jgi:K+-sensing histidine kinase KdpD
MSRLVDPDEMIEDHTESTTREKHTPSRLALGRAAVESRSHKQVPPLRSYFAAMSITAGCTAVAAIMFKWFAPTNLAMVYLLGVVLAATRFDRRASVVTAVLGTLAFDFLFIPPLYSFAISDTQYLLTAVVLLTVGLVVSALADGLRRQARVATERERRTAALYAMTRKLAVAASLDDIAICVRAHIAEVFDAQALIYLKSPDGNMRLIRKADEPATAGRIHALHRQHRCSGRDWMDRYVNRRLGNHAK